MSIIQKNIFGDNIIYQVSPNFTRNLDIDLKSEILNTLKNLNVTSVTIRFESSGESAEFVAKITNFLKSENFAVYSTGVMMSEIQRNQFTIEKHPSDPNFAKISIGTLM